MRRFGECNYPSREYADNQAINQPGTYLNLIVLNGVAVLQLDCWSWMADRGLIDSAFDVDTWTAMTLNLEQPLGVSARQFWYTAFQIVRALVSGETINLAGTSDFSIEKWVAQTVLECSVEDVRQREVREGWPHGYTEPNKAD